jgi:hypothetical protein
MLPGCGSSTEGVGETVSVLSGFDIVVLLSSWEQCSGAMVPLSSQEEKSKWLQAPEII